MQGGLLATQRPGAGLLADIQAPMPVGDVPAGGLLGMAMQALLRQQSMAPAQSPQPPPDQQAEQDRAMAEMLGMVPR